MPTDKKHPFSGLFEPLPAHLFIVPAEPGTVTVPAYATQHVCTKFGVPCTLALYMRNCKECSVISTTPTTGS